MEHPKSASQGLSLFSLLGRTAIVSGVATSGIGYAIAEILAEAGADVAILYNRNVSARTAADTIVETYQVRCTFSTIFDKFNDRLNSTFI
jgi:sorbose reductase